MEARNITIINSRTQTRTVITSSAETLEELKRDLENNEINYEGQTFFEGISKTELTEDSAILPKDLPWKDTRTNDLVFMLTEPQKKIRNGAVSTRAEAYAFIKEHSLQEEIQKKYGDNFTRCKTVELVGFCNNFKGTAKTTTTTRSAKILKADRKVIKTSIPKVVTPVVDDSNNPGVCVQELSLEKLVNVLIEKGIVTKEEVTTGRYDKPKSTIFTDEDIDKMFKNRR